MKKTVDDLISPRHDLLMIAQNLAAIAHTIDNFKLGYERADKGDPHLVACDCVRILDDLDEESKEIVKTVAEFKSILSTWI